MSSLPGSYRETHKSEVTLLRASKPRLSPASPTLMRTLTLRRSMQTSFFRYVVDVQSYGSSMGKIPTSFHDSMELISVEHVFRCLLPSILKLLCLHDVKLIHVMLTSVPLHTARQKQKVVSLQDNKMYTLFQHTETSTTVQQQTASESHASTIDISCLHAHFYCPCYFPA